jgi:PAS domain-containing protein
MSVLVGVSRDAANEPLAGLAATARGLAALGSLVVLTIAGIFVWTITTASAASRRRRAQERNEITLTNVRHELAAARHWALLTEPEAGALLGSATDGVALVDPALQLRQWNERFAERAGVALDAATPIEELFRRQAAAGLFGAASEADPAIATRLTLLHEATGSVRPLLQAGPDGAPLQLAVRGVSHGGYLLVLTKAENAAAEVLPDVAATQEITDW